MQQLGPPYYSHAVGSQRLDWRQGTFALYGAQSNEKPWIDASRPREHSLSQLWGIDDTYGPTSYSTQEFGWNVDFGLYGDLEPHLFVFHFDRGNPTCYNRCGGWVPYTNVIGPGSVVTHNDAFHVYVIQRYGSNWWFYYDGYWLGYLPSSAYPTYFNTGFTRMDAGGEVSSSAPNTCTDMGNAGLPGTIPGAAAWQYVYRVRGDGVSEWANFSPIETDPDQYRTGGWVGRYQFRYGGGGWC